MRQFVARIKPKTRDDGLGEIPTSHYSRSRKRRAPPSSTFSKISATSLSRSPDDEEDVESLLLLLSPTAGVSSAIARFCECSPRACFWLFGEEQNVFFVSLFLGDLLHSRQSPREERTPRESALLATKKKLARVVCAAMVVHNTYLANR